MLRVLATFAALALSLPASAQTATRAADFVDSMGVVAHIAQGVESDPVAVSSALQYLGINHIRDDGSTNSTVISNWLSIHSATGATFVILPPSTTISTSVSVYSTLHSAGALLAAEGPNEPNNFPVTYGGATSCFSGCSALFTPVAQFQRDLYSGVKAAFPAIPVFASSEAGGSEPNNVGLQWLTIPTGAGTLMPDGTIYADYCNTHNYVQGSGMTAVVDNNAYGAELTRYSNTGPWDGPVGEYGPTTWHGGFVGYSNLVSGSPSPGSPLGQIRCVTTETGWVTQGTNAITEDQQGKLFVNLYLDAWALKWSYTFIYMMRDDPSQGYWGLFHQDWTPKLSAQYVGNLTKILSDTGATARTFAPSTLAYTLSGPATVHSQLFEKSDGSMWLAAWDERASGSDPVSITLPANYVATQYDPTVSNLPIGASIGSILALTMSDHANIWRITPTSGEVQLAQFFNPPYQMLLPAPSGGGCTAATNFLASAAVTSEWVGTATISGTVMTVSATTSGTLTAGQAVNGTGITVGTTVSSLGTYNGTSGTGTVNLSMSNTVGSGETVTASMATTNNAVITTAICNMVTNGVGCSAWSGGTGNVDRLYVMAASDGVSGVVDWCGHGVATKNGTCTFTANTGWNGDGSSCYFATGFVPSTAGGNWTQNSAVISACDLTSRTAGSTTVLVGGIGTGPAAASYFFPRISTTFGADLDGNTFPSVANTNAQGRWIVSRTGSTNFTVYLNGSSFSTLSSTSFGGATTAAMPMLAYNNNGTIADFSTDVVGYVFFGGGETSTAAGNMYNALHTLMAALGNGAC